MPLRRVSEGPGGGTITRRVARILALPAIVVLLLLGLVAAGQVQDYRSSQSTSRSVKLALAVQDLVHELQTERGITAGVLGGNPSFRAELGPSRKLVDQQRARVDRLVSGGGDTESQVSSALQQLDGLDAVRAATDSATAARAATFKYFTDRITALSAIDVGLDNTSDDELRQGVATLQALQDLAEATAQERAFLNGVFSAGGFAKGEFIQFAAMRADKQAALTRFDRFATPGQKTANNFVFSTGAAQETANFENVALDAADGHHIVVNPQSWWSGLTTVLDDLQQLQQHVGSQIQVRAHDLQEGSTRQIGFLLGVVLLCFAGSIYLAALATLSITRPLAALAAEADSVAASRLPEAVALVQADDQGAPPAPPPPVQVPSRATEEIRSVAKALDRLQSAAYGLATEQAMQRRDTIESLANLGRRNQNLIRRQLGFITSLEREEIDPSSLANLFELDHLATRMRRNAASLLVLVDAASPRQWSSSVSVADVIRAAVSEVEEYRRVSLRRVDDALVTGSAIGSIAHLLSELIENALTFSPPDTEVEVQGRRMGDGYLIAITDQGVGMSSEDLRQANARLRGEGDFIAAPTRFLGHFVVGKLARDTSVNVELLPSPVTGVTARVTLPQSLLSAEVSVEVKAIAESAPRPRHAGSLQEQPAQLTSHLLALPRLDDQDEPDDAVAETADPWNFPGSTRPAAAFPGAGTPAFGVPLTREPATGSVPTTGDPTTSAPAGGVPSVGVPAASTSTAGVAAADRTARPLPPVPAAASTASNRPDPDRTPSSGLPLAGVSGAGSGSAASAGLADVGSGNGSSGNGSAGSVGSGNPSSASNFANSRFADSGLSGSALFTSKLPGTFRLGGDTLLPVTDSGSAGSPPTGNSSAGSTTSRPGGSFPEPSGSSASGGDGTERTQNGLRKRTPRSMRAPDPAYTPPTRRVIDLDASTRTPAVIDHAPADVSARLTALRAGLQRGKGDQVASAPRPGQSGSIEQEVEESE
jgi:signal transduction histidine kinase